MRRRLAQSLRGSLRTAREGAALTQVEMAERLGLGLSTYCRLERGRMSPGLRTLRRLRRVLCLSLDALLGPECAEALERVARAPRRRRRARAAPRVRTAPRQVTDPWELLAAPRLPRVDVVPLLLVRRGTPLALVVDVG